MSTTLAVLTTKCRRTLRDAVSASYVFTDAEIADIIGEGIDALTSFYPKEIIGTIAVSDTSATYAVPTGVTSIFRVDLLDSDGELLDTMDQAAAGYPSSGWQKHGSFMYFPSKSWGTVATVQVWGYGPWAYIDSSSGSTDTTDLDQSAVIAIQRYAAYAIYERLCSDRGKFQQLQQRPENTDVQPIALLQYRSAARQAWEAEKSRLRFLRKIG